MITGLYKPHENGSFGVYDLVEALDICLVLDDDYEETNLLTHTEETDAKNDEYCG
jgi:hypothetical protein